MYYLDANSEQLTLRSSSQQESMHRWLAEAMPGTHRTVETAHLAFVDVQFRCAVLGTLFNLCELHAGQCAFQPCSVRVLAGS